MKKTVYCNKLYVFLLLASFFTFLNTCFASSGVDTSRPDLIVVQVPIAQKESPLYVSRYIDGCSIHLIRFTEQGPKSTNLTPNFISARDPSVSFDGKTILFAGKKDPSSNWQIYRMNSDSTNLIQLTSEQSDHSSPLHVGTLFYLNNTSPIPQIVYGKTVHKNPAIHALFASNSDGTNPRQISHNIFSDIEPDVLPNGRLVYGSYSDKTDSGQPLAQLMALNIDGTDLMPVTGDQATEVHQRMPRIGYDDKIYYIETSKADELGGGQVASVSQFRSLHSHQKVTTSGKFLFPCPLPDGTLLASHAGEGGRYSLSSIKSGEVDKIEYHKLGFNILDAQVLQPRTPVRGRSSVVGFRYKDTGVFFCMDVYMSDRPEIKALARGSIKEVLITEGVVTEKDHSLPLVETTTSAGLSVADLSYFHRIIGRVPVEEDGSFQVRVPSETRLNFHLLDENGKILASQKSWTWVMHGESRACIGCHEDRELSPPNRFIDAVKKPPVKLVPQPDERQPVVIGDAI